MFAELAVRERLPSMIAPAILKARKAAGCEDPPYAGPADYLGEREWRWGAPSIAADEFVRFGLDLIPANEDANAGLLRLLELRRPDPAHEFPKWHPRKGEPGSPRLFVQGAPRLVAQLALPPPIGEPEQVQRDWERSDGGLATALRYAVMSLPSPSEKPEEWIENMRDRLIQERREGYVNPREPVVGVDYEWV